jgi:nucleoid-associated protein YgaU
MTTDAKIGLLLGLVFIVIIAFVINGLPSFHKDSSSNELTNDYVTQVGSDPIGLADSPRQGLDSITEDTNSISPKFVSSADKTLPAAVTQVNNVIETSLPVNETAAVAAVPAETVATQETLMPIEATKTQASEAVAQVEAEKTQVAANQKSTVHVVAKGENLGLIAQKYYGTQGPKKANVKKIAEINHLKSERNISIGQKLTIPTPTALSKASPSMFEEVKNMGKSLVSQKTEEAPTASKGLRDYVVKKGDHPYKIAAKELGSGTRYKEIFKYNPGITEKTTLSIGMHLKLPQR